jgi:hypothetical protein
MDIEAKKIILIEELLKVEDEEIILKIESLLHQERNSDQEIKPMTLDEFHEMINQSQQDIDDGRVISHEELKRNIGTWK